ncbi:hypothetical protein [Flavobacterium akiainvivens]|uniref:hypothetical protein n=1 Tax=Flavobacterium akiainvivens TaxID=1202724 RepID=UPI0009440E21|nr:hypothetical protein [Flavobacterium akiainvivens]
MNILTQRKNQIPAFFLCGLRVLVFKNLPTNLVDFVKIFVPLVSKNLNTMNILTQRKNQIPAFFLCGLCVLVFKNLPKKNLGALHESLGV